jgi:ATP-dependent RNA helicase DDX5/DBP2
VTNFSSDSKQARDLVSVLTEAKQQVDPRLAEMARYGGRGGGRGGGGGKQNSTPKGFTSSNAAPLGGGRRW